MGSLTKNKVLVTGCAGFVGSHLSRNLLSAGYEVKGIDNFSDYYSKDLKERNLDFSGISEFYADSLGDIDRHFLDDVETVFHLAAQPGVRKSWNDFEVYTRDNLLCTQILLDAMVKSGTQRIVFASSSSVYGESSHYPVGEGQETLPRSPYGVTKLAGEALLRSYSLSFGLETTALRFFTVYGPGQRPDMAIERIITAAIEGRPFTVYGTGRQIRDFTFVSDVVGACIKAAACEPENGFSKINVGGSGEISLNDVIEIVSEEVGRNIVLEYGEAQKGDVTRTGADCTVARELLHWAPTTGINDGILAQTRFALEPKFGTWDVC